VISIIDDDASCRVATNGLVRAWGFKAHTFVSAEEFLRSPRLNDTSCLITDIQMPGVDGLELQGILAARGNDMPIIFITAFPDERVRARALKAGAVAFLSKPFEGAALIQCIDRALKTAPDRG
jgi:FixJ family two-component response regulator